MGEHRNRIVHLDGLRGVAILLVVLWHYTNWGYLHFFPYGATFASIPLLDHGWAGVNIFFLISGYVILLTLERCTSFSQFMARRWLRLFPAMLIASLCIFATSRVLGAYMPHGRPGALNLLPGLTFVIPTFWTKALQRPVDELDGVFWTLYVEMGFYVTFGLLYFKQGWRKGLVTLATIWLVVLAAPPLARMTGFKAPLAWIEIAHWFGATYFGWFVSGALFLKSHETGSQRLFGIAIVVGLVSAITSGLWQPDDTISCLYLSGCVILFATAQKLPLMQRALSSGFLLFVGAVSYPLYLLHNEIGIGLIAASPQALPRSVWLALPVLMLALMMAAAWTISHWMEPWATARFRPLFGQSEREKAIRPAS